jgi:hypothetical protein
MTTNPFDALGLPAHPDLTDEQVRAAWRSIAAATHPDRPGGGDPAAYARASAAYADLRTAWGRSEAYADLTSHDGPGTEPLPVIPAGPLPPPAQPARLPAAIACLPARILHGRPLRLLARTLAAALASLGVLTLIPGQPAEPAVITGLITWMVLTARKDLAPPPRR